MDSNPSRQSRLNRLLTQNQLIRSSRKLNFRQLKPRFIDIEPYFFSSLMLTSLLDIKEVLPKVAGNIEYPCAMFFFGWLRMKEYIKGSIDLSCDVKPQNCYVALGSLEKGTRKLAEALQLILVNLRGLDIHQLDNDLNSIFYSLKQLLTAKMISLEYISYLAIEFYKEVPFFSDELNIEKSLTKLSNLRTLCISSNKKEQSTLIEKYLNGELK